jgi:hypothetical protein
MDYRQVLAVMGYMLVSDTKFSLMPCFQKQGKIHHIFETRQFFIINLGGHKTLYASE